MKRTSLDIAELITAYYPKLRKVFRNLVSIRDVPISMTQLTCLTVIGKQEELTMSALAEELSMSNQQLTKVVDALVDFNLVERITDPTNRRKIYAKLTPTGKHALESLRAEIMHKLERSMNKYSPDEVDKLYDCLAHIASYFGYKEN